MKKFLEGVVDVIGAVFTVVALFIMAIFIKDEGCTQDDLDK